MKLNPLILDLKGTILEAYHADMTVEPITGEVKEKINTAEHGFATWLSKVFDNALEICESPIHMIAVVDDGNTYRKAMFPAYKQKRAELKLKADSLELEQIEKLTGYVKQFLASMGVPLVRLKGQEADDVIAYLCKKLKGHKTVITNDKDLVVLAAPDVTVLRGGHIMESYTSKDVVVPPHLVSLFLSIVGDSADGFPGLDREGPKAWEKMVEQFGVDGMEQLQDLALKNDKIQIKAIASIAGNKTLTKLADNYDQWRVQFLLAQLNPGLCEGARVALEWYVRAPTKDRLVKVLTQAGAWDLVGRYETYVYKQTLVTEDNLSSVLTEINELTKDTLAVAWDYETFDTVKNPNYVKAANGKSYVDVLNSAIAGCSFALGPNLNHVYYFSVNHADTRNVGKEWVLTLIKHFEDEGVEMVAQNCVPGDTEVLTREGWKFIKDASVEEEILQWDSVSGHLQFVKPLNKTEAVADTLLAWNKINHVTWCTPQHRIYFKTKSDPFWRVSTAEELDLKHGNDPLIPISGQYFSKTPIEMSDSEVRLMEAIRADGHFSTKGSYCRFHLSKPRKILRLETLLKSLDIPYSKTFGKDGAWSIGILANPVSKKILSLIGKQKVYGMWLLDLPPTAKQALLEELVHWDGGSYLHSMFCSTCKTTVEALQILAHTSGWSLHGKFKPNYKSHWKELFVGTLKQKDCCKLDAYNSKAERVAWGDKVYCFTVPSGAFMVRRDGVVSITGNCAFESTITKVQLSHEIKYWNDTKAFAHHIDENAETGLKHLSKRYLNYDQVDYHTTLKNAGASDMSEISGEQVLSYGCDDSLVTAHLYRFFTILTQLENTYDFIQEYECPAVAPLTDSYIQGVKIDVEEMERQAEADRATVKEKMALLRELLKANATNPRYEAVDALYEDQKAYIVAKAHERLKDGSAAEKDAAGKKALAEYLIKLKDNCRYIEPYEVREFEEFIPTPAKLKHVTTLLGLPPCEKVTKSYLTEWLSDNPGEFADLLAPAVAEFKTRTGDNYDKLVTYCNKVLHDAATPTQRGTELNLGSPSQMQYLLYLLLGLPIRVRTKVQKKSLRHKLGLPGSPSTDASAIDFALANDCNGENAWKADVLKTLKTYAAAATRLSIYWAPYPLWIGEDHIMHPNFISPGTVTRRPTGSSPNLLQVSKGNVRKIFVPRSPDNVIASIDFASQELRVMAAITGDENFLSAYTGPVDKDLHAMTACGIVPSVYGKYEWVAQDFLKFDGILIDYDWFKEHQDDDTPVGKMLKDVRGMSKTVNFGVGYGAVAATVSQQAMIPLDISELAVNGFHAAYPGVNRWKESVYAFARQHGYVATTYGSRRHCGNALNSGTRSEIGRWERQLSNFLIQGQCADLLKVVLANAHKTGLFKKHGAMLIAPIYDEILVEVPRVSLHAFLHDLADLMEINMPGICVKMVADCSFGANWGKQEEVGARPTLEKINEALAKVDAYLAAKQSAQPGVTNEIQTSLDSEDDDVLAIVDESDTGTDL